MRHLLTITIVTSTIILAGCGAQAEQTQSGAEFQTTSSAASSVSAPATIPVTERFLSGGILELGSSDAPISMLLFINHSSEYSQQFNQSLLPRLLTDYVQKGTLQIGIIPMQFQKYPESQISAAMLLCASMQGKGQAMNNLLFAKPAAAELQKQIGAMGLHLDTLKTCLQSDTLQKQMNADAGLIQSFGITLAPSYTINGAVYTGLPEYADLQGQMKAALSR